MRRRRSKKGISLVELIIVITVSVLIIGASLAALCFGAGSAAKGAEDCSNHGDASMLETWLRKDIPTAADIQVRPSEDLKTIDPKDPKTILIYFDTENSVMVKQGGKPVMSVSGVDSLELYTKAYYLHQELCYTIKTQSENINPRSLTLEGGVVMNNLPASPLKIEKKQTVDFTNKQFVEITKS